MTRRMMFFVVLLAGIVSAAEPTTTLRPASMKSLAIVEQDIGIKITVKYAEEQWDRIDVNSQFDRLDAKRSPGSSDFASWKLRIVPLAANPKLGVDKKYVESNEESLLEVGKKNLLDGFAKQPGATIIGEGYVERAAHKKAGYVTWSKTYHNEQITERSYFFVAEGQMITIYETANSDAWERWSPMLDAITQSVVVTPFAPATRHK